MNTSPPSKGPVFSGPVTVTSRGIGYLSVPDSDEDLEIRESFLNTALHGDIVEAIPLPTSANERRQGEVVAIKERRRYEFVGTAEKKERTCFILPDDRRMYKDIFIPSPPESLTDGEKVVVRIKEWTDSKKNPEGEIVTILGRAGEHNVEMNAIVREKGFETEFPPPVEKQAQKLRERYATVPEDEEKKRKDMRDRVTFTIDPASAKDFDDALSVRTLEDGLYEIGIHIADVSHFVERGSPLDKEARKRGTSVYLVDRTIPMLPEILSNDLCSLNPKEVKFAFSAVFSITADGDIRDRWFGKTLITSDHRFAYEDAQDILDTGSGDFFDELTILNTIARELRKKKFKKGAIDFETDEVEFDLDENGVPQRVILKERLEVHKLIEDFMLLANKEVALFLHKGQKKKSGPSGALYRIHDRPDPEKIESLLILLRALGHEVQSGSEDITPADLNAILHKVTGRSEESLVRTAAIRSMQKAIYSTKNKGHFGLAFEHYTHFTSPIRRYPDLIVHRLLEKQLRGDTLSSEEIASLEAIAADSTEKEIRATEAERESVKLKQVEFMENHVGEIFTGVISGVTSWGLYVEEKKTLSSGMVPVRSLTDDFYELDQEAYALVGKNTGKRYTLGDEVTVKLTEADREQRQLTFEFAERT